MAVFDIVSIVIIIRLAMLKIPVIIFGYTDKELTGILFFYISLTLAFALLAALGYFVQLVIKNQDDFYRGLEEK